LTRERREVYSLSVQGLAEEESELAARELSEQESLGQRGIAAQGLEPEGQELRLELEQPEVLALEE
jgi:hypothetical protein